MSDFKNIISSIKEIIFTPVSDTVKSRAKNTFFGSFIISWGMFNWEKLAYFTLSNDDILTRITIIHDNSRFNVGDYLWVFPLSHSLVYPCVSAIVITYSQPFINYAISKVHRTIFKKIFNFDNDNKIENAKEQKKLISQLEDNESEKSRIKANCELEIAELKEKTTDINKRIDTLFKKRAELNTENTELEIKNKELKATYSTLSEKHQSLLSLVAKINSENNTLIDLEARYQDLLNNYRKSQNEVKTLKGHIADYKDTVESLKHMQDRAGGIRE